MKRSWYAARMNLVINVYEAFVGKVENKRSRARYRRSRYEA
jgi:hypothetical protein